MNTFFTEQDIISRYTRQQAIEDGVLIDITKIAKEAGFNVPAAITAELYGAINPAETEQKNLGQDFTGRLWDMLTIAMYRVRQNKNTNRIEFKFVIQRFANRPVTKMQKVSMTISGGDYGEPVITFDVT